MEVAVLRLNHRYIRDDRVTTHLFLTARAFGASKVIYSGQKDDKLEERIRQITKIWGGDFEVEFEKEWKQTLKRWKKRGGKIVHLTIYGIPIQNLIHEVRNEPNDKIIIVGGAKVPRQVYEICDWNVSITSQPHSEISALSVFLHELFEGEELTKGFQDAKLKVIPKRKGKEILKL